jgi:hypothetical protein
MLATCRTAGAASSSVRRKSGCAGVLERTTEVAEHGRQPSDAPVVAVAMAAARSTMAAAIGLARGRMTASTDDDIDVARGSKQPSGHG